MPEVTTQNKTPERNKFKTHAIKESNNALHSPYFKVCYNSIDIEHTQLIVYKNKTELGNTFICITSNA